LFTEKTGKISLKFMDAIVINPDHSHLVKAAHILESLSSDRYHILTR
jgi:hypothetical protein